MPPILRAKRSTAMPGWAAAQYLALGYDCFSLRVLQLFGSDVVGQIIIRDIFVTDTNTIIW